MPGTSWPPSPETDVAHDRRDPLQYDVQVPPCYRAGAPPDAERCALAVVAVAHAHPRPGLWVPTILSQPLILKTRCSKNLADLEPRYGIEP